mmetsp:Transcript_4669/g.13062  ORF Transcript_4669/g.13062 Transcript_4669/m.13062 type:complete len:500 (+) Transcript_4669:150-1649(+)
MGTLIGGAWEDVQNGKCRGRPIIVLIMLLLAFTWIAAVVVFSTGLNGERTLSDLVAVPNIMEHLEKLEEIAMKNGGSRSIATGYNDSALYVESMLLGFTNFEVSRQYFVACAYTEITQPALSLNDGAGGFYALEYGIDFQGMRYGGNSTSSIAAEAVVMPSSFNACSAGSFVGQAGKVVLLRRTTADCEYYEKALSAQEAGVAAVLFYSSTLSNSRVRQVEWQDGMPFVQIPVLSVTNTVKNTITANPGSVELSVSNRIDTYTTYNLLAETLFGSAADIVMPGAHLDSVAAGPGLNDNGSGSSTLLEIALQTAVIESKVVNRIRFAWWGAEEEGLLGSRHYVRMLSGDDKANLAIYINHDMLASPNYIVYVKNASDAVNVLQGGKNVQALYQKYYESNQIPYDLAQMRSGSDFQPFVENGINSAGCAAGAGTDKTMEERSLYGGAANAPLDTCYHQECDTVENINQECLGYISGATSAVVWELATMSNLRGFLNSPSSG